ncbi:hypothetical protein CANCADRAFT_133459 [Tortispora caseinolytica NRRL Y-17796]|uniref:ditrans,polycis-polyprenyl diphosphate synthase [(2E,6E)-farnesyldiphosphate specific] n=1 Tax=Tortispora caseinolytica NRRL Y-17796 TaxID=767744 RepID=A0A1E4TBE3_9ASCO|nr:hypothetical protein CANCADRAFT_133459 [Tortispora caseinolytica NRRL Y-17796]
MTFTANASRAILVLLHWIVYLHDTYLSVKWLVISWILGTAYSLNEDSELVRADASKLRKKPRHLSVILQYTNTSGVEALIEDTVNVVCWSIAAGLNRLTVYERTGILKEDCDLLQKILNNRLQSYMSAEFCTEVKLYVPHTGRSIGPESGFLVSLISEEDGKETIVDLTKSFCEMSAKDQLNDQDITVEMVDSHLQKLVVPEPDLLIVTGKDSYLYGYPPWQLRVCEIYFTNKSSPLDYVSFLKGCINYSGANITLGR